jgi:8-oxo-dGTP pyrophosphatase MutT (NUDIX family)
MVALVDVEAELTLFAEGIAGTYYHVKPTSEFASRHVALPEQEAAAAIDTLYVPDELDYPDSAGYRVLVMLQLGHREFGTYSFNMPRAITRIPILGTLVTPEPRLRESDFSLFFRHVPHPATLRRLFSACERFRITARLLGRYPGLEPHLTRYRLYQQPATAPFAIMDLQNLIDAWEQIADGTEPGAHDDATGLLEPGVAAFRRLSDPATDVFDAASVAVELYLACAELLATATLDIEAADGVLTEDALEWMQREARLEDWENALEQMDQSLLLELPEGAEVDAAQREGLEEAGLRDAQIDIRVLTDERDNLKRRLDMERSAIADALGPTNPAARSYRYDEWDYLQRRYLRHWCRLFEERLEPDPSADPRELIAVIRQHAAAVMRQLEQIKPLGYQRVRRVADGDELDFNALIDARQDVRAGISPDERVYSRKDRIHRDVCAAFLVDLSASTDDPIDPPEPQPPLPEGVEINLRDPYDDDFTLAHDTNEEPRRRIIDLQRESMLVMSAALERLGDSYGIYGFSGYGRDCVEFYVAKEPGESFTQRTLEAIASMKPRRSTRMGPAIRHAVTKLIASGNAMKILMILSDGFPQDSDYGPERGNHEYGLEDTARAIAEAHAKGVEVFCVTVDKSGNDYLKRMCPASRYLIIDEIEDLPERLSTVYQTLTGR